jgi:hypothetical protein
MVESGHPSTIASLTSTGRLTLAVLGGPADIECDLVGTRTAEGRNRAKPKGKHMWDAHPSLNTGTAERGHQTPRKAQGATLQELADSYDRSPHIQPGARHPRSLTGTAKVFSLCIFLESLQERSASQKYYLDNR